MGQKILGTKGFQVVIVGQLPPGQNFNDAEVTAWVLSQLSMTFPLGALVRQSTVTLVPVGPMPMGQ